MHIKVSKKSLVFSLELLSKLAERRETIPILSNFVFSVPEEGGKAFLYATNYANSLRFELDVEVQQAGTFCCDTRMAFDACRHFIGEEVNISFEEGWVLFRSGEALLRLPSMDVKLYPEVVWKLPSNALTMEPSDLKNCIESTLHAVKRDETQRSLMGVCLDFDEKTSLSWTATDGYRLVRLVKPAIWKNKQEEVLESIIVPRNSLQEMLKILTGDGNSPVLLAFDQKRLFFQWEKILFSTDLIDSKYPNVDQVIPAKGEKKIGIERDRFEDSLRLISFIGNEGVRPVKLCFQKNKMVLKSGKNARGDLTDSMDVEYSGEDFEVSFNSIFLLDMLGVFPKKEKVEMEISGALSPSLFRTEKEKGFFEVVMPIKNQE